MQHLAQCFCVLAQHDMVGRHFRQLVFDKVKIITAGININVLFWKNICKAVKCLLKLKYDPRQRSL